EAMNIAIMNSKGDRPYNLVENFVNTDSELVKKIAYDHCEFFVDCSLVKEAANVKSYDKEFVTVVEDCCADSADDSSEVYEDRLLRFGSELIFALCEHFGTEVVIINIAEESTFEKDLVQDVLEIITVFSAKLYGARSHKSKKLIEAFKAAADGL